MDSLFENHYTHTKQYYKEFYAYFFFKRPLFVIINVILVLYFLCGILSLIFPYYVGSEGLMALQIFLPLLVWLILLIRYIRTVNIRYKQDLELNGGQPLEVRLVVTEDGIDVCKVGSEGKNHLGFAKIKKTMRTKNYYILMTAAKLCCTFKTDGFAKGDLQGLLVFLRTKGIQVKGAKRA